MPGLLSYIFFLQKKKQNRILNEVWEYFSESRNQSRYISSLLQLLQQEKMLLFLLHASLLYMLHRGEGKSNYTMID